METGRKVIQMAVREGIRAFLAEHLVAPAGRAPVEPAVGASDAEIVRWEAQLAASEFWAQPVDSAAFSFKCPPSWADYGVVEEQEA